MSLALSFFLSTVFPPAWAPLALMSAMMFARVI